MLLSSLSEKQDLQETLRPTHIMGTIDKMQTQEFQTGRWLIKTSFTGWKRGFGH